MPRSSRPPAGVRGRAREEQAEDGVQLIDAAVGRHARMVLGNAAAVAQAGFAAIAGLGVDPERKTMRVPLACGHRSGHNRRSVLVGRTFLSGQTAAGSGDVRRPAPAPARPALRAGPDPAARRPARPRQLQPGGVNLMILRFTVIVMALVLVPQPAVQRRAPWSTARAWSCRCRRRARRWAWPS